jgi:hypothetical protein
MTNVKTRSEWRTEGAFTNLTTSTPRQTERDHSDEATTRAKIQMNRALHNSRMCTARMAWVTYEPGFISAMSDSEIKFSVDLSRGTCSETKSDLARSSAFETCGEMRVNQTGGRDHQHSLLQPHSATIHWCEYIQTYSPRTACRT